METKPPLPPLMRRRYASINDVAIQEADRKFRWERRALKRDGLR
jgi:nuclear transport factor 2 (NTF2) superfamily protein